MAQKEKNDYTMLIAVLFVIAVLAFGYYALRDKKEPNPLESKNVIDMNTSCAKAWEGAELFAQIYGINTTIVGVNQIIIAQCKIACEDQNNTYYDYKCTSSDKFLCYCNKK
ncbi:MAG: hypothetical protein AABW73_01810 [Nanoarchaeota archaeon]